MLTEEILGSAKFQPYLEAADGDRGAAERLAMRNLEVSQRLFAPLSVIELALRNGIHAALSKEYGEDWLVRLTGGDVLTSLPQTGRSRRLKLREDHFLTFQDARRKLESRLRARNGGHPITSGGIIGATSFGVWVGLLGKGDPGSGIYYDSQLWAPLLSSAFPGIVPAYRARASQPRMTVDKCLHKDLDSLLHLRNRIAHHERIIHQNPRSREERLLRVTTALFTVTPKWLMDFILERP